MSIILIQFFLFVIFFLTLGCEVSKKYSDSFILISLRTIIMCTSAIAFFTLFEKQHYTLTFLMLTGITFISGGIYITLETLIYNKSIEYYSESSKCSNYNVQQESN